MKAVSALLPRQWRAGVLLAVRPWRQLQPLHKQYIGLTFTSRTMLVQAPPLTASMHSQVAPPPPPLLPAAVQSMVKDLREDIEFALEEADGSTIAESAQHAYLEMDPVARDEPGAFTLRYQVFAYHRLQGVLRRFEAEMEGLDGSIKAQVEQQLRLARADAKLARDKLKVAIECASGPIDECH